MDHLYVTIVMNRCPDCQQGELFRKWFILNDVCPYCRARFFRDPGSWTGPVAFGYGIGAVTALGTAFLLWRIGWFDRAEWLVPLAAVVSVVGSYRFVKAWWVGMLYSWHQVYPDPTPLEAESPQSELRGPGEE